jgi:hypothetical protein
MATQQNYTFTIGTDWIIAYSGLQYDGVTVQDLTGSSLQMQISNATGVVVLASQITVSIATGTSGQATITVPRAVTKTLKPGAYDYTVRCLLSDGTYDDTAIGVITAKLTPFLFA